MLAAGVFRTIEEAQDALCLKFTTFEPQAEAVAIYERLYTLYRKVYFALGTRNSEAVALGDVLPEIRKIAAEQQRG
jgi:L-ribulokinase